MSTADPQSFNRYTYCDNDPVNKVDLLGLSLADIGVYQTENPAVAATLDTESMRRFKVYTSAGPVGRKRAHHAQVVAHAQQSGGTASGSSSQGDISSGGSGGSGGQQQGNVNSAIASAISNSDSFANPFSVDAAGSSESDNSEQAHGQTPQGASLSNVSFETLWSNHPKDNLVITENGQAPKGLEHQCTIKMSLAFKRSGISLSSFKGAMLRGYAVRAYELADWVAAQLGPGLKFSPDRGPRGVNVAETLRGRTGIVLLRDFWGQGQGHFDLFNGNTMQLANGVVFTSNSYFDRSKEITFWEIR